MVNVQEVRANKLIEKVAGKLKEKEELEKPEWAKHVKTGPDRERRPDNPDWWYNRQASILRKIYMKGPQGVESLRNLYGGKDRRGRRPERRRKASGKIIRTCLQQLEEAGYLEKADDGRGITSEGRSLLDKTTVEIKGS